MSVLDAKRHHEDLVEDLIAEVEVYNPEVDKDLLRRAFDVAVNLVWRVRRRDALLSLRAP